MKGRMRYEREEAKGKLRGVKRRAGRRGEERKQEKEKR